jgi:MoaA/NifB/PqqE/SkfB family radical SAM enzyme
MDEARFDKIVNTHKDAIIHITGGEPSIVKWLYPYLKSHQGRFHLNTNAIVEPPFSNIQRLKISLDSHRPEVWDKLVGLPGAFDKVISNIRKSLDKTTTSITCVLNKQNYKTLPDFVRFCNDNFPGLYAIFFSVYKGTNPSFVLNTEDVNNFFGNIKPQLESLLPQESLALLQETIDDKVRIMRGVRFPNNNTGPCYISLSERVYDWEKEGYCNHLYRDGVYNCPSNTTSAKCLYGCNQKLVAFNNEVAKLLNG